MRNVYSQFYKGFFIMDLKYFHHYSFFRIKGLSLTEATDAVTNVGNKLVETGDSLEIKKKHLKEIECHQNRV